MFIIFACVLCVAQWLSSAEAFSFAAQNEDVHAIRDEADSDNMVSGNQISHVEIVWSMQMGLFGFSGFMNEFLGVASEFFASFPRARLTHAYFWESYNESALSEHFLSQLFLKERFALEMLYRSHWNVSGSVDAVPGSVDAVPDAEVALMCLPSKGDGSFRIDATVSTLGNMWKPFIENVESPSQCCSICAKDSHCIGWSAYRTTTGIEMYLCELKGSRSNNDELIDASMARGELIASGRFNRVVYPRVKVFHGTTCAFQNISLQKPSIDEIRIGRYMVERDITSTGLENEEMAMLRCAVHMDEVWVPTVWNRDLFVRYFASIGFPDKPVFVVPEAVDITVFNKESMKIELVPWAGNNMCSSRHQIFTRETFQFLSIFKWEYRKGWDILLKAYWQAFTSKDNVVLRLHTYLPSWRLGVSNISYVIQQQAMVLFGKPLEELAAVEWIDSPQPVDLETTQERTSTFSRPNLAALIASADAFVLPTRGEGWGLPVVEAMAMKVPVIVTNHSGPAVYANEDNAYLIPVLAGVDARGFARPDIDALVRLMRLVVVDSCPQPGTALTTAQIKASKARKDLEQWSPREVVKVMQERVEALVSDRLNFLG
jgi:glycosyltransferase involved in cell wall biosynthesis